MLSSIAPTATADDEVRRHSSNSPFLAPLARETIPYLHMGGSAFLIASGPSLARMDLAALSRPGLLTMGLNNSPRIFRPLLWVSVDTPARFLESIWLDPSILKFVPAGKLDAQISRRLGPRDWEYFGPQVKDCPGVIGFRLPPGEPEFDPHACLEGGVVHWGSHKHHGGGRTVLLAAIGILYRLGIRRIYLVGVDFRMTSDATYAFDEQRTAQAIGNNRSTYLRTLSMLGRLARIMPEYELSITQCTPDSDLKLFPYMPLAAAISAELAAFPDPTKEETYGRYLPDEGVKIPAETRAELARRGSA